MWDVSEKGIICCINWAIVKGDLRLANGNRWQLKRSETEVEKETDPSFVLIDEGGADIYPCPDIIEIAIRAGCLEDRGAGNVNYRLID